VFRLLLHGPRQTLHVRDELKVFFSCVDAASYCSDTLSMWCLDASGLLSAALHAADVVIDGLHRLTVW
jgi:hypothetical protein